MAGRTSIATIDEKTVMTEEKWEPDMVVGVDFGMTCTAVTYSMGPTWPEPKPIQRWPGKLSLDICNKVPTAVEYDERSGELVGWGFKVGMTEGPTRIEEFFKLNLDPNFYGNEEIQCYEAHRWLTDYLNCLFEAIEGFFADRFPRTQNTRVEYLFSMPTTWVSPAVISKVEGSIRRSAFGKRQFSTIKMSLTEAEAAAVYASKQKFKTGEVVITCDAGGGTTDLNVLRIKSASAERTELEPLVWVEGNSIGSTIIDFKVEHIVAGRLRLVQSVLEQQRPEDCAKEMMKGRFERFKCSFGSFVYDQPVLRLPIPNVRERLNIPDARIEDSNLLIYKEELQAIFNEQIERMDKLIDEQIQHFKVRYPNEHISYLILSGGLGSSEYVRKQLRQLCATKYATGDDYQSQISILVADEPQLAVALGLVMNRVQELSTGASIFPFRCARNSYGILTRERYQEMRHMNEDVSIDPRDGRKWAEMQIHWLIKKGQLVSVEAGIEQPYALKLNLSQVSQPWNTQIVMSTLPVNELPQSLKHQGAKVLCKIESYLSENLLRRKNAQWWNLKREHFQVRLILKILIGAADLKFQIWTIDRQRCSRDHDQIKVAWDESKQEPANGMPNVPNVYPEIVIDNRSFSGSPYM